MKIVTIFFVCCVLAAFRGLAQDTAALSKPGDTITHSYFSGSLGYLSNSVYNGRKDSMSTPYITGVFGYYHASGLFIDGSVSYLAQAGSNRIDLFAIEAGYSFDAGDFDGEIAVNKYFYNSGSTNVSSAVTGSLSVSGGYDFTYIKPVVEAGIIFGSQPDYTMNVGLEHTFYQLKDKLQFTPGVEVAGSTQSYYGAYYNRRTRIRRKKNNGIAYDVNASVQDAAAFKILDYQFSLPIGYTIKKCSFLFSPAYVLPVHPAVVNTQLTPVAGGNTITKTSVETISSTFYCSFTVSYKF